MKKHISSLLKQARLNWTKFELSNLCDRIDDQLSISVLRLPLHKFLKTFLRMNEVGRFFSLLRLENLETMAELGLDW
jgi:hypothetical protein